MPILESRVPPPAIVLVMAAFMWLISRPYHRFIFTYRRTTGLGLFLSRRDSSQAFRGSDLPASQNDGQSNEASRFVVVTWASTRFLAIRCTWAVSSCCLVGNLPVERACLLFLPIYVLYINRFQIAPEERVLTSLFGETYVAYQMRARRWCSSRRVGADLAIVQSHRTLSSPAGAPDHNFAQDTETFRDGSPGANTSNMSKPTIQAITVMRIGAASAHRSPLASSRQA